jgi:hypothetical protein
MIDHICDICKQFNTGDNWCLVVYDDRDKKQINGHKQCVDQLDDNIKGIKDVHKLSVDKVLKKIKFEAE